MSLQDTLMEKLKQFESLKNQLAEVSKRINALTEEQRAIYNQGLELKGAIDALVALKAEEDKKLSESATAKLTLPEGVKPVVAEAAPQVPSEVI